jgi:putative zinc finger/helix-turn-helix YgiT family protein
MEKKAYCSKCEQKQHYFIKQEEVTRKVKENTYVLNVKVAHCAMCDEEVYIPEISDEAQQAFFNAYRADHQLLTPDEIVRVRKAIGLNQRDFSRLLGFGEITISRYELGSLPSKNNALAINKTHDKKYLEEKYEQNRLLISEEGRKIIEDYLKLEGNTTGKVKYSQDKFFELTYLFIEEANKNNERMTETKLNKLLFYADFNHFLKFGKGITGSKYIKLHFGPVPNHSQLKYSKNPYISFYKTDDDRTQIDITDKPARWHLDDFEKKITEAIYSHFKGMNAKTIFDMSHQESAWTNATLFEMISYERAKELKIRV